MNWIKGGSNEESRRRFCFGTLLLLGTTVFTGGRVAFAQSENGKQQCLRAARLASHFQEKLGADGIQNIKAHAIRYAAWCVDGRMPDEQEQAALVARIREEFRQGIQVTISGVHHSLVEIGVVLNIGEAAEI